MYLSPSNPPDETKSTESAKNDTPAKGERRSRIWTLISQEPPLPPLRIQKATNETSVDKSGDEINRTNTLKDEPNNSIQDQESSENVTFEPKSQISDDEKPKNIDDSSLSNESYGSIGLKEPKRVHSTFVPKRRLLFSTRIQRFSQSIKTFASRSVDYPPIDWHDKVPLVIGGAKKMQKFSDNRLKMIDAIKKNMAIVQKAASEHQKSLRDLLIKEEIIKKSFREELQSCITWASKLLQRRLRNLCWLRVTILQLEQEIEQIKLSCIDTKLDELHSIMNKVTSNAPFIDIYKDNIEFSEFTFQTRRRNIDERTENILRLRSKERTFNDAYLSRKKIESQVSTESRSKILTEILDSITVSSEYFEFDPKIQRKFDMFVRDIRFKDGIRLSKTINVIKHDTEPNDVTIFIEDFVNSLAEDYNLEPNTICLLKLRILFARTLYPLILDYCELCQQVEVVKYQENIARIKSVPIHDLRLEVDGILRRFELESFLEPIEHLRYMWIHSTPVDMAVCIRFCLQSLFEIVNKTTGKVVGADETFPLLVLCVAHADIPHLPKHIAFLSNFLQESDKFGSLGYSVAAMEAVLTLISNDVKSILPEETPKEIKND